MDECQREIATVLNRYCKENDSNTPDFILATYLMDCLNAFNSAVSSREKWYNIESKPGKGTKINNKLEDEIVEENGGAFINSNLVETTKLVTVFEIHDKKEVNIFEEDEIVDEAKVDIVEKKQINVFDVDEEISEETKNIETKNEDVNDFWNS
jgi:uncharacterized protein YabE (DUF348 family)